MADEGGIVEVPVSQPAEGVARVGGGIEDPAIAKELALKASTAALRKQRKEDRLRKEADAARRKTLQDSRILENSSRKRAREKETIAFYFTSSCNFDVNATGGVPGSAAATEIGSLASIISAVLEVDAQVPRSASLDAASNAANGGMSSEDVEVIRGSEPPITLSTDSSAYCLSEDNPNWHEYHDVPTRVPNEESEEEDFLDLPPLPPKKTRKNYEVTWKFQMDWLAKCPWSEMIMSRDGLLHMVKCSICTAVRGRLVRVVCAPARLAR
jgi:hypothetical protein